MMSESSSSSSDDFFDSDSDSKKGSSRKPVRQGFENDKKKSSAPISVISDDEESFANPHIVNQNGSSKLQKLKVHLPSEEQSYNSDDSGSTSVTDVSPLPSSDSSPKRKNSIKSVNGSRKLSSSKYTKASKSIKATADFPRARRSKAETLSIDDLDCTSDSNSISGSERDDGKRKHRKVSRKKKVNYDELHHRMETSTRHHRRRLLDVAAQNSMDISQLLEVVLEMEQEEKRRKSLSQDYQKSFPHIRHTRNSNKSFSRNRARDIEIENERLYRRIAQQCNSSKRPSSASSVRSFSSCRSTSSSASNRRPATAMGTRQRPSEGRLYHSATNRIRDQQRIEQENLALLRRLQGARASNDLRRDVLLQDYERQTGKTVYSAKPKQRRSTKRYTKQMQQAGRQTWQDSW